MLIPTPAPLPVPCPTTSYWQSPPSKLRNHRTTAKLPLSADYVVIGSGIAGSSLALKLLEKQPGANVVLLEARDACSGASGRNGGHCRPGRYTTFSRDAALHGEHEAELIARFEERNVRDLAAFVHKQDIDCQLNPVTTIDIFETGTEPQFEATLIAIQDRDVALARDIAAGNADERVVYDDLSARLKFQTPNAIGAVSFPAYSINPYLFVCGVLKLALEKGLNLQTGTPVHAISSEENSWTIKTDRGNVTASNLILATNAYTSHLLPQASRFIKPVRNQAVALHKYGPASEIPFLKDQSICFNYATDQAGVIGDDYMVNMIWDDDKGSKEYSQDFVLGGGRHLAPNHEEYNTDDSTVNKDITDHLSHVLADQHFRHEIFGDDKCHFTKDWSGIVGHTPDDNPVLGPVPGKKGLWICAGFNGHGMALAFRSAEAVSTMVLAGTEAEIENWVPRSFLCGRKGVEMK